MNNEKIDKSTQIAESNLITIESIADKRGLEGAERSDFIIGYLVHKLAQAYEVR